MPFQNHKAYLLFAVTGCVLAIASAQTDPPQYALRDDSQQTGSIIRKEIAWSSQLPLNRTYAELTTEQKKHFHSNYESIAPGDEPPFPIEGLKPIVAAISKAQKIRLAHGDLRLIVTVGPDGMGKKVESFGTVEDAEMTKFAVSVLLLTKYKPAVCNGAPCTMQFPFRCTLKVKN